ncbi:MAG: MBL fold metallo-hydrolase [Promethearchaeia archaeon]
MSLKFVKELSDNIYFIKGQRSGKYPYSHSLLIGKSLIDTGISSRYIRKLKRKYAIKNVLLTHWHEDHISGNRLLPKARFFAHEYDVPIIEDVNKMYSSYYVGDKTQQKELFEMILGGLRLENTEVDHLISNKQTMETEGGFEIKVIHTPGHSAGHCCFLELSTGTAFLGDIDLSDFGPWYAARDSSLRDFEKSIQKIEKMDINLAATGHREIISGRSNIQEDLKRYREILTEREDRILSLLPEKKPTSLADLIGKNIIYHHYSKYEIYEKMAEKVMIQQHLEKLVSEDKIKKENGKFFRK